MSPSCCFGTRNGSKALNVIAIKLENCSPPIVVPDDKKCIAPWARAVSSDLDLHRISAMLPSRYVLPTPFRPITTCTLVGGFESGSTWNEMLGGICWEVFWGNW